MKRWRLWSGLLISAIFLYWALSGLQLGEVWEHVRTANYWWLFPSVAVYFLAVWARTWRWDYMLRPIKRIPVSRLFPTVVIGYMGNNVYPFRAGEVLRSYVLRRREGIPMSSSLATVLVERVFDGLVMLIFVLVGLPLVKLDDSYIIFVVILASIIFTAALAVLLLMAAYPAKSRAAVRALAARLGRPGLEAKVDSIGLRFIEGLGSLRSVRHFTMIFLTSIVIWLLETVKYWFVMHAFDFEVSFFALMLMNGVVNLATTLPSAPGYFGTFDGPGIYVLSNLYGVERKIATGYTLVLHAALWLPITLLGAYYMLRENMSWADFSKAREMVREDGATV